jgi:hypothetical protein
MPAATVLVIDGAMLPDWPSAPTLEARQILAGFLSA